LSRHDSFSFAECRVRRKFSIATAMYWCAAPDSRLSAGFVGTRTTE
jgi:hypothetical protein